MKPKKNIARLMGFLPMMTCVAVMQSCGSQSAESIAITKLPDKIEYKIDQEISLAGGELTATYKGKSEGKVVSLEDPAVEVSAVKTSKAGKKSVAVTYDGCRTRFNITIDPYVIQFETFGKGEIDPIELKQKGTIDVMPDDPSYEGFEFGGWFVDSACSNPFDIESVIQSDMTLYAMWIDSASTYYNVTFANNYYGSQKDVVLQVEEGQKANAPADPSRTGYAFDGWYTASEGGQVFDFESPILSDTTLYAHWRLTSSGINEYVFEAEDVNLAGKKGRGYSGEAEDKYLVQRVSADSDLQVSNDRFLGYTYDPSLYFDFDIASDRTVSDAKIVLRLSGEFADFTLTPDMFVVSLNDVALDYGSIVISDVPNMNIKAFDDFVIVENATLNEGANNVQLKVNNSVNWIGGGTVAATAPLIDCMKITTSSVLWWDGAKGLPANNYRK